MKMMESRSSRGYGETLNYLTLFLASKSLYSNRHDAGEDLDSARFYMRSSKN